MSKIVSEDGYVLDFIKHDNIKFSINKKVSDYTSSLRPFLQFREAISKIWFETECLKTKGMLEEIIEGLNERICKELNI